MPRLKLIIAYVGTDFHGWQTQAVPPGQQEQPTIQSTIMRAVESITGRRIHVHGAGRTDSGVHARAQIAHLDVPESRIDWQLALNTKLPPAIRIVRAEEAAPEFHAQHSAVRKTYRYSLWLDRGFTPPHLYPFVWNCGPLDEELMECAAEYFLGTQDFSAIRNAGTDVDSAVRTVSLVQRETIRKKFLRVWRFEANGFLKQMVRNMMGVLVRVGQHKIPVDSVPELLQQKDRRHAGVTAPAYGLCLHRVWYKDEQEE